MFFRQILAAASGHTATTPEIYFVPSFYVQMADGHAMRDACQQLSLASGQIVVFVNQRSDPDGQAVFVAGVEIPLVDGGSVFFAEITPALAQEHAERTAGMRRALNSIVKSTRRTL
jgi:hypothetical protein